MIKPAKYEQMRNERDRLAAELAEVKAQRDSWRRIAESGLGITKETSADDEQALTDWADRIAGAAFTNDRGGGK